MQGLFFHGSSKDGDLSTPELLEGKKCLLDTLHNQITKILVLKMENQKCYTTDPTIILVLLSELVDPAIKVSSKVMYCCRKVDQESRMKITNWHIL